MPKQNYNYGTYRAEAIADVGITLTEREWKMNGHPTHAQAKLEGHRAAELREEREAKEWAEKLAERRNQRREDDEY